MEIKRIMNYEVWGGVIFLTQMGHRGSEIAEKSTLSIKTTGISLGVQLGIWSFLLR